jgi:RND family efflux transporter MFP subunit
MPQPVFVSARTAFAQRVSLCAVVITACVGLTACQKPAPAQEPLRSVKVMTVGASGSGYELEFSGEVRARVESNLAFRVAGKLVSRPAELGQRVSAGQLLAQIDPEDYRVTAEAAAAQWLAAKSNRDVAQADFKRYQDLHAQGFISIAELDRREAAMKLAQAQYQQAQAQNTVQGNQSGYTRLVADGAGVVTSVDASAGQVVSAGQPVVRLALDGPRDVVFSVPENKLADLKAGQMIDIETWDNKQKRQAKVRDVAGSADTTTRTFVVKAALEKDTQVPEPVLGSTVTVRLKPSANANAQRIKLPTTALRQEAGATSVWVLDANTMTVSAKNIEVSVADGNDVVVNFGLQKGDQVVTSGVHVLTAGQKVSIFGAKQ